MVEKIQNILVLLTGLGAAFSIYLKTVNEFTMNMIRSKYKNAPGKKSVFHAVIELIEYCFILTYIIIFIIEMINFFTSKEYKIVINNILKASTLMEWMVILLSLSLIILPIISMIIAINNFLEIKNKFIKKLENKDNIKIDSKIIVNNKIGMMFSIIITAIWLFYFLFIFTTGINIVNKEGIYFFENNIPNDNAAFLWILSFFAFISTTSFIILNSLREIYTSVNQDEYYILNINNREVSCQCYLEYEEYFLIFENEMEKYIKKSEVKEIKKIKKDNYEKKDFNGLIENELKEIIIRKKNSFFKLEENEFKELRKSIKNQGEISQIESVSLSYLNKSNEEKLCIEYELKNYISDINKLEYLSIIGLFLIPIIENMFNKFFLISYCLIIFIFLAKFIPSNIERYKFYKFYLNIIEDIKNQRIVEANKEIKGIKIKDILEVNNINSKT